MAPPQTSAPAVLFSKVSFHDNRVDTPRGLHATAAYWLAIPRGVDLIRSFLNSSEPEYCHARP